MPYIEIKIIEAESLVLKLWDAQQVIIFHGSWRLVKQKIHNLTEWQIWLNIILISYSYMNTSDMSVLNYRANASGICFDIQSVYWYSPFQLQYLGIKIFIWYWQEGTIEDVVVLIHLATDCSLVSGTFQDLRCGIKFILSSNIELIVGGEGLNSSYGSSTYFTFHFMCFSQMHKNEETLDNITVCP